ncbi:hypothetical protein ESCO_001659 [Escovopsis weberi]|uniref:AB hydrolase-1 domain-containing protein n=1 Tax=Escovopsis weberi TaxID=150374 RepID=A0A0M8N856_ESCWE|nr:hypothetical protein ESCO_001659 [Escovopsis weberi]
MKGTLVLCFIHGFKGGDDTFGDNYQFIKDLRDLVARDLPSLQVRVLVYPKYETRGDLGDCVSRFRDWLEEKVIDMEVAAGTQSPTVDPSVRVVLVGHSMGGIVAAETVAGLASDTPIRYTEDGVDTDQAAELTAFMFPRVQGVLAFDTPFLGISPGVVAHGAEGHYQTAQSALAQLGALGTMWTAASNRVVNSNGSGGGSRAVAGAPQQAVSQIAAATTTGASGWSWGKMALAAGAAGAVAVGGAAAWANREHIGRGWTWVSSHLEFVGCLARPEALKQRVARMVRVSEELDVGFANVYTRLGRGAQTKYVSMVGTVLGRERTFCNVPSKQPAGTWIEAVNDKASEETGAHTNMFTPRENPGYEKLSRDAKDLIVGWVDKDWYKASDWA